MYKYLSFVDDKYTTSMIERILKQDILSQKKSLNEGQNQPNSSLNEGFFIIFACINIITAW